MFSLKHNSNTGSFSVIPTAAERGVLIWMWRALSAPKARSILAQRNALGLKEPQSFPARCAGLIPFGASSAEDKLGHYSAEGSRAACGAQAKPLA